MSDKIYQSKDAIRLFILFCVLFSCFSAKIVYGQPAHDRGVTSEEKAIFAFFRAANVAPDYEFWIKSSYKYRRLDEHKQQKYFISEMMRLGRGYSVYDKERDVLIIKADIFSRYIPGEDGEASRITFRFFNAVGAEIPSFNFPYGDDIVSLVIDRLSVFSDLKLKDNQREVLLQKVPYLKDDFDAKLEIHVRVARADLDKPLMTPEKKRQWLMVGDIAYLKCTFSSFYENNDDNLLWDYLAPWYEAEFQRKKIPDEAKYPHPYDLFKE